MLQTHHRVSPVYSIIIISLIIIIIIIIISSSSSRHRLTPLCSPHHLSLQVYFRMSGNVQEFTENRGILREIVLCAYI